MNNSKFENQMIKEDFVKALKDHKKEISDVGKQCQKAKGKQIQSRILRGLLESLATKWFEQMEQPLQFTFQISNDVLQRYHNEFGKILEISGTSPAKGTVLNCIAGILRSYHVDLVVPVQKHQAALAKFPSLDNILSHAHGQEVDYLREAVDCARLNKNRAAIILGWCAAVDRLHRYIEKNGIDKFNQASVRMSAIQSGRYKRFNKKFEIQNLSDLRMSVFDNDLLWVLEFMGVIDGNQHERLEICFTMRNTSAHPGDANISDENVLSFFSDIDSLVFIDPKFNLTSF